MKTHLLLLWTLLGLRHQKPHLILLNLHFKTAIKAL